MLYKILSITHVPEFDIGDIIDCIDGAYSTLEKKSKEHIFFLFFIILYNIFSYNEFILEIVVPKTSSLDDFLEFSRLV